MFERFTDRARRVLVLAQEEARLLNHSFIGTEHILLGLIHEGEGVAAKAAQATRAQTCRERTPKRIVANLLDRPIPRILSGVLGAKLQIR